MPTLSSVELDRDPRSIIGMRVYDAPRELVFSAFTDVKHLSQWWGPNGFSTTTSTFEFRPGGHWRYVMHGPDGRNYENLITFEEIVPPQRIVSRHGGSEIGGDHGMEPVQFRTTILFEDLGGGKTRLTWRGDFSSAAERDRVVKEHGAAQGLVQNLERLAAFVAALA